MAELVTAVGPMTELVTINDLDGYYVLCLADTGERVSKQLEFTAALEISDLISAKVALQKALPLQEVLFRNPNAAEEFEEQLDVSRRNRMCLASRCRCRPPPATRPHLASPPALLHPGAAQDFLDPVPGQPGLGRVRGPAGGRGGRRARRGRGWPAAGICRGGDGCAWQQPAPRACSRAVDSAVGRAGGGWRRTAAAGAAGAAPNSKRAGGGAQPVASWCCVSRPARSRRQRGGGRWSRRGSGGGATRPGSRWMWGTESAAAPAHHQRAAGSRGGCSRRACSRRCGSGPRPHACSGSTTDGRCSSSSKRRCATSSGADPQCVAGAARRHRGQQGAAKAPPGEVFG